MTIKLFKYPLIVLLGIQLYSCSEDSSVSITSNDIVELKKYVNLDEHEPIKAKWTYEKMGNQSDSRTPGPNDYKLEAQLEFDKETIKTLKENYLLLSVSLRELRKEQFRFDWLDKKNLNILNNNNALIYYHPNFFKKGSLIHGGYTIIDETTILLSLYTM